MKIGEIDISKVMVGSDEVTAIYAGLDLVYSGGTTPPTPTGSCLDYSALTRVFIDENFNTSTFPLEIYQLSFGGLGGITLGSGGFQTVIDLYNANNNWIGSVQVDYDSDSQSGDLTVFDTGGTGIYTDSDALAIVNVCSLFGGAVYIQDVPSVEVCTMYDCVEYDCLEWDEETGECIEQGECIMEECVMSETFYPLEVFVENNS